MGLGFLFATFAAMSASCSNYFMRRILDVESSNRYFLVVQLFVSFIVAILLQPILNQDFSWSHSTALFGVITGIILGLMMACMGKAMEYGPPGLTIGIISAAAVAPILLMFLFFGEELGYEYRLEHGLGALLVITGLFWAGVQQASLKDKKKWLLLVSMAFIFQVLGLTFLELRALFINHPEVSSSFSIKNAESQWFSPILFFTAFLVQCINTFRFEKRVPTKPEVLNGSLGGAFNGLTTIALMLATEYASSLERAMIFPLFVVFVIVFCNIWGQLLYKEKVNWKASSICLAGILVGSINWSGILFK